MANTYHQIYVQAVFAVKYRRALLDRSWREQVQGVIGQLINETGCRTIIVNGVEDHLHCLLSLNPTVSISELMKTIKAKSSRYINENNLTAQRFEWQRGYGAFSYSQNHVEKVFQYIQRQEEHHRVKTFTDEYLELLDEFNVGYDKQYVFQEP